MLFWIRQTAPNQATRSNYRLEKAERADIAQGMETLELDEAASDAAKAGNGMAVSDTARRMADARARTDGRARTSAANGKAFAGAPKGKGQADKKCYDPAKLADGLAERIVNSGGIPRFPLAHGETVTEYDRAHVRRIVGIPAEEFQNMITARLQVIAEKTTDRVLEKLDEGNQKLSDLNMTLAISIDKLAAISGRTAQSGNVSVTVNNYGAMTREQMLATVAAEAKAINV